MATAAAVVGAVAAVASLLQQRKAGKEQVRQTQIRNRVADAQRKRNIRRAIAQARIRRAEVESTSVTLGVAGGSAAQGAAQGITGDLASVLGAANLQFSGQTAVAASANRVSALQQSAATFGSISSIAGLFTSVGGEQNVAAVTSLTD